MVIQNADVGVASVGSVCVPFEAEAMRSVADVPSISMGLLLVSHLVLKTRIIIGLFVIFEEREFRRGRVFTDIYLGIIACLIVCRGAGFAGGLAWCTLKTSNIRNHGDDVLSDGFVRAVEFYLLGSGVICVLDGFLVHEVLTDGDGDVF